MCIHLLIKVLFTALSRTFLNHTGIFFPTSTWWRMQWCLGQLMLRSQQFYPALPLQRIPERVSEPHRHPWSSLWELFWKTEQLIQNTVEQGPEGDQQSGENNFPFSPQIQCPFFQSCPFIASLDEQFSVKQKGLFNVLHDKEKVHST